MVIISALAVVVMVGVIVVLNLGSGRGGNGTGADGLVRPPASNASQYADGGTIGEADAPVVLEVYSDYQCPVCGRFGRDYLPSLVNEFVSAGQLRIEERSIAILGTGDPDESLDAAVAAEAAGRQGKYWEFHDYLMWNQSGENRGTFSRDRLRTIADEIGLDRARFDADLVDASLQAGIRSRTDEARQAGIDRTPTFVLNGERIVGLPRTYEDLASAIRGLVGQASPSPAPEG